MDIAAVFARGGDALALIAAAHDEGGCGCVGLLGNAADVYPKLVRRGIRPDAVTDQTSAHDSINGNLSQG